MTDPRGVISKEFGGKTYQLEMNMGVLADLQDEFGEKFDNVMNGVGPVPVRFIIRAVCLALMESDQDVDEKEANWLARKIAGDKLFSDLLMAAFPDAQVEAGKQGNGKRPKRAA